MDASWARHVMCESAFTVPHHVLMLLAWIYCLSLRYRLLWNVPLTTKCFYEERGFTVSGSELLWIFVTDTILRGNAEWPSQSPRCRSVWSTSKSMCGRCNNKEASAVCLSHCKNCIHVASITFTLRFTKHEFLPRTTFCRDVQYGRTSTARNCPSCTTLRDSQITSGAINTCSAAANATGIYDYNDAEIRFTIRRCRYLM